MQIAERRNVRSAIPCGTNPGDSKISSGGVRLPTRHSVADEVAGRRLRRPPVSTRDQVALPGRGLALCRAFRMGSRRKERKPSGGGRLVFLDRIWRSALRTAGLPLAESLGPHGSPHLHESLVGVIFRLQNGYRWLVPLLPCKASPCSSPSS